MYIADVEPPWTSLYDFQILNSLSNNHDSVTKYQGHIKTKFHLLVRWNSTILAQITSYNYVYV